MRITKTMAKEIATKMVAPISEQIKALRKERSIFLYKYFKSKLPIEISKLCFNEEYAKYFCMNDNVKISFGGRCSNYFSLKKELPINNYETIFFTGKESDKMEEFEAELKKLFDKKRELKRDAEIAIFEARTDKRLSELWPEAFTYLPKDLQCTAVAVQIDTVKNKFKNL